MIVVNSETKEEQCMFTDFNLEENKKIIKWYEDSVVNEVKSYAFKRNHLI